MNRLHIAMHFFQASALAAALGIIVAGRPHAGRPDAGPPREIEVESSCVITPDGKSADCFLPPHAYRDPCCHQVTSADGQFTIWSCAEYRDGGCVGGGGR